MGAVTIYLNADLESKMRVATKAMRLSQSKWIARIIQRELENEWPQSVIALAGAWKDFPSVEEIRETAVSDIPRESF